MVVESTVSEHLIARSPSLSLLVFELKCVHSSKSECTYTTLTNTHTLALHLHIKCSVNWQTFHKKCLLLAPETATFLPLPLPLHYNGHTIATVQSTTTNVFVIKGFFPLLHDNNKTCKQKSERKTPKLGS